MSAIAAASDFHMVSASRWRFIRQLTNLSVRVPTEICGQIGDGELGETLLLHTGECLSMDEWRMGGNCRLAGRRGIEIGASFDDQLIRWGVVVVGRQIVKESSPLRARKCSIVRFMC